MDARMFDEFYEAMSEGDKQHMANRLYKYDQVLPQKLKAQLRTKELEHETMVETIQEKLEEILWEVL